MFRSGVRIRLLRLAFIPVVLAAVFTRPRWSNESYIAFVMESCGYLLLLVGLIIRLWCVFYIGGKKSKEIVTSGPYSLCRNPLYMGTFVLAIGLGLSFENLLMFAFVPLVIIPVHLLAIRTEEVRLEEAFGEQYRLYKQKVPRLWPRFSNYNSPHSVDVSVHAIWRIAGNTVAVLLLPWIEDLIEVLHHYGIVPILWYFP